MTKSGLSYPQSDSVRHVLQATVKISVAGLTLSTPAGSPLLHNISLNIPAGKIVSLIGPSGSGKSTLLRCLNRLWEPPPARLCWTGWTLPSSMS